jgi:hypothetical protein
LGLFKQKHESLKKLEGLIINIRDKTPELIDERSTGSYTNYCSRTDLLTITKLLPPRNEWNSKQFNESKNLIKERYNLSNKQFSIALDKIQKSREMKAILGVETLLLHITDNEIVFVIKEWRKIHPNEKKSTGELISAIELIGNMESHIDTKNEVLTTIKDRLSKEAVADLETIFYLGRDGFYSEYYEREVENRQKNLKKKNDHTAITHHLIKKTNLLQSLNKAAIKLGRLTLHEELNTLL